MKNIISEIKTTPKGIKYSLDEAENQISDLEDKVAENTQSKQQKRKKIIKKNEDRLRDLWDQKEERDQGIKTYLKK